MIRNLAILALFVFNWIRQLLAIVRDGGVLIPHHDTVIESGDHVIVFCTHKRVVGPVERLFQLGAGFL